MKWKALIAMAAISIVFACNSTYRATDNTGVLVSVDAQRAFELQYPNSTNVIWSTYDPNVVILNDWQLSGWDMADQDDYLVRFDYDNEKYYAWYDRDGTWIGSAYVVNDQSTLPQFVRNSISTNYVDYTISSVNKEFHKDRIYYEVVLKNNMDKKMVLLMDPNGSIIRTKEK
jgi:hypothetical protein